MSDVLQGIVSRIIYSKDGWTVARLKEDITEHEHCFIGNVGTVVGEHLELTGSWATHENFGRQFKTDTYSRNVPTTDEGVIALLSSGLIRGIGSRRAQWMVEHFGASVIDIIRDADDKLLEVPGIGPKLRDDIFDQWHQFYGRERLVTHLASSGFTKTMIRRIMIQFDDNTLSKIEDNPYELMRIPAVGFYRADYFAKLLGASDTNPTRIQEAIVYLLEENGKGNTYLPKDTLFSEFSDRVKFTSIDVDKETLYEAALKSLSTVRRIIIDKKGVHLTKFSMAETSIAKELIERSLTTVDSYSSTLIREYIKEWEIKEGFNLTRDQESAVVRTFLDNVTIITGAPGTGKTSTLAAILYVAKQDEFKLNVSLAAPTGRAAKRMQEATGVSAATIHRLLGFGVDGGFSFKFNKDEKYPTDILIVDEVSMIDVMLMNSLLRALKRSTKLILVGDKDQLQSVSAGNVLDDVIKSGKVNTIELRFNFRQKSNALLVKNANKVNSGHVLNNKNPLKGGSVWGDSDFYITNKVNKNTVVDLVIKHIPTTYNIDPEDILIITPIRKRIGELNCSSLNDEMQVLHNNNGKAVPIKDCNFRIGDRVMQTRNDYTKDIFNGDVGRLVSYNEGIDKGTGTFVVDFYNNEVQYDFMEWKQLQHAWVTTVHKAQGSEALAVICILPDNYITRMMLTRNLLYTGITRASKVCVLVAKDKEIIKAIKTSGTELRYTDLTDKLENWYRRLSKVSRY